MRLVRIRENGTVIYMTKYNEYWKENIKLFKAVDFIAGLTLHIPPKHKHLGNPSECLYYGLYSSRTKVKANEDGSLAKFAYRHETSGDVQPEQPSDDYTETVSSKSSRQSWARLIQKVYEVDPWSLQSKLPGSFGIRQIYQGVCFANSKVPPHKPFG